MQTKEARDGQVTPAAAMARKHYKRWKRIRRTWGVREAWYLLNGFPPTPWHSAAGKKLREVGR